MLLSIHRIYTNVALSSERIYSIVYDSTHSR